LVEGTENLSLTLVDGGDYDLGLQATATIAIQDVVFAPANTVGSGVISRASLFGSIILGNNANNAIAGTTGSDTIAAFAGDDVVYGFNGNDSLDGGLGNDLLVGGNGNDTLQGSVGNDTLIGVDLTTLGLNEVDVLAGGLDSTSQDRFVLGIPGLNFYVGGGNADYAQIVDFEVGDILQLAAAPSQVVAVTTPAAGIGIFVGGDLVAVVQGTAATLGNVTGAVTVV
jgi:Ca2+-binding RTX toxin-like protein